MPRPRKPTQLLVLRGTAKPDRIRQQGRDRTPHVRRGIPEAPPYMSAEARPFYAYYARLAFSRGVLTVADRTALELLASTHADLVAERRSLAAHGATAYQTRTGSWRPYPEVAEVSRLTRDLVGLLGRFGMTPADRMRVSDVDDSAKDGNDEKWDELK